MKSELETVGIELVSIDLMKEVWIDRPDLPKKPFYVFDLKYSGQSTTDKIAATRAEMAKLRSQVFVMSALDDIAWLIICLSVFQRLTH
jgi:Xaa-Pro aminopeptidase